MKTLYTRVKPTATSPIQHSTNESLQISISHSIQHSVRGIILVRNIGKGRAGTFARKKLAKGCDTSYVSRFSCSQRCTGCTEISQNSFDAYPVGEICFCYLFFYYLFDATVSLFSVVQQSRSFLLSFFFFVALLHASVFVHKKLEEFFNETCICFSKTNYPIVSTKKQKERNLQPGKNVTLQYYKLQVDCKPSFSLERQKLYIRQEQNFSLEKCCTKFRGILVESNSCDQVSCKRKRSRRFHENITFHP